jgi:hypothetical protein
MNRAKAPRYLSVAGAKPGSLFRQNRMWLYSSIASFVAAALVLVLIPFIRAAHLPYVPFLVVAALLVAWGIIALFLARRSKNPR